MADNYCIRLHFVDGNRAGTVVVPFHNVYWDMEMVRNIVIEGEEELVDNHIDSCLDYMDIEVVVAQDNSHSQTMLHNFDD